MHENITLTSSNPYCHGRRAPFVSNQITPDDYVAPVIVGSGGAGKTRMTYRGIIHGAVI